jgi:hypothetical protein
MGEQTAWEKAAAAEGTTDSERALTRLAKKAFRVVDRGYFEGHLKTRRLG